MDEARRKIRICLVCIVMIAVIVGIVYYMNDVMGSSDPDEGTLVRQDVSYTEEHAEVGVRMNPLPECMACGMYGRRKAGDRHGRQQ